MDRRDDFLRRLAIYNREFRRQSDPYMLRVARGLSWVLFAVLVALALILVFQWLGR